jgi:hypothetical protein
MANLTLQEVHREAASMATYRELVGKALRADRFAFDEFPVLSELPVVEHWAATHPRQLLARGRALEAVLRAAIGDVLQALDGARDRPSCRLTHFNWPPYLDRATVTAIAGELGMDRALVHRLVARRALEVIALRVQQLAATSALRPASATLCAPATGAAKGVRGTQARAG